jgi:hypothetical protein
MVNAKNYAFKVHPQAPNSQARLQAYGTVINCRKPGGKRAAKEQKEVRSRQVPLVHIEGTLKRKWGTISIVGLFCTHPAGTTTEAS